jgi:hypothetical protein
MSVLKRGSVVITDETGRVYFEGKTQNKITLGKVWKMRYHREEPQLPEKGCRSTGGSLNCEYDPREISK